MRHLTALLAMECTRANNGFKLTFDAQNLVLQHAPIGFDLRFTRTTQEPAATALTLKVGPASDKTAFLIIQMRKFDLQRTFLGACSLTKNFENETRTIDDLDVPLFLQIALLNRRQRMIDDNKPD